MQIIKGEYNVAKVYIDTIDDTTKDQIQLMMNTPVFGNSNIAIMPDCHKGAGSVIGFTATLNDYVVPNVVGVDIGCGVHSYCLGELDDINFKELDDFIKNNIPHGFGINSKVPDKNFFYFYEDLIGCVSKLELDEEKVLKSIGSLGGGNHFIEVGKDSKNRIWITVHSGSRNFGLRVAQYHQEKARKKLKKYFIKDDFKDMEFLIENDAEEYLHDMKIAQKLAMINRIAMLNRITDFLKADIENEIVSVHNYIDFSHKKPIIRKGAISAKEGEKCLIPFNMRDGIAIGIGKGNEKYNFSAPHGAGRILSRKKALQKLNVDDFKKTMEGIYTTTANKKTLDEAPDAYKDMNIILDNIHDTVSIVDFIKPLYNFKSS